MSRRAPSRSAASVRIATAATAVWLLGAFADAAAECPGKYVPYVLGAAGGTTCPPQSTPVPQAECEAANAALLRVGETPKRTLQVGEWGHVPGGCSRLGNVAHYNRDAGGGNDGTYTPLCTAGNTAPTPEACPPAAAPEPPVLAFTVTTDPRAARWCPSTDPAGVRVDVLIPAVAADADDHARCDHVAIVPLGSVDSWHDATNATERGRACPVGLGTDVYRVYRYVGAVNGGPATAHACGVTDTDGVVATHAVFECVPPGEHEMRLYRGGSGGWGAPAWRRRLVVTAVTIRATPDATVVTTPAAAGGRRPPMRRRVLAPLARCSADVAGCARGLLACPSSRAPTIASSALAAAVALAGRPTLRVRIYAASRRSSPPHHHHHHTHTHTHTPPPPPPCLDQGKTAAAERASRWR